MQAREYRRCLRKGVLSSLLSVLFLCFVQACQMNPQCMDCPVKGWMQQV